MTSPSLVPSLTLANSDWEKFKHHLQSHYPKVSFNHFQRDFVEKSLLHENGTCNDSDRLWVTFFVQNLVKHLDEGWAKEIGNLTEQVELLHSLCAKAMLGFYDTQHAIRLQISVDQRTAEQKRMLEINMNVTNFPVELCVDIGRIFHIDRYRNLPRTQSSTGEEISLFERVNERLQHVPTGTKGKLERQVSEGSATPEHEWTPHSADDTFMRYCLYTFLLVYFLNT